MNLKYLNELENLIQNQSSVEGFKKLYEKYFHEQPNEKLVANYEANIAQVDAYNDYNEDSYYYEESYDDDSYD